MRDNPFVRVEPTADWELWKRLRLAALAEAPKAFGSSHEEAYALPDEEWQRQVREWSCFIGFVDGEPSGIAAGYHLHGPPELTSMWVSQTACGTGLARLLVETVGAWAKQQEADSLLIGVVTDNVEARKFYEKVGAVHVETKRSIIKPELTIDFLELAL